MKNIARHLGAMTSEHYRKVQEFHREANQPVRHIPQENLPPEERILRAKLVLEEAFELVEALGVVVSAPDFPGDENTGLEFEDLSFDSWPDMDLVGVADGCADLSVVTMGTLIQCGIYDRELLREVDRNNLEKFGPGGRRNKDGKWVKPPNHQPPDITGVLRRQAEEVERAKKQYVRDVEDSLDDATEKQHWIEEINS